MNKGFTLLLKSRKGTLALLSLLASIVALYLGKIEGTNFAAIVATVIGAFSVSQAAEDTVKALKGIPKE